MVDKDAFAAALKGATNGRSVRSLAEQTGWGRTTVHEWLTGVRLPSEQQVEDLLGAVGSPPLVVREVQRLRRDAADPVSVGKTGRQDAPGLSGETPDTGADAPPHGETAAVAAAGADDGATSASTTAGTKARRVSRPVLVGVVGLVVLTSFAGGFVAGRAGNISTSSPSALPQARVEGTLGKGLISHRGPDGATERVGSLYEGQVVGVACISPTGSHIEDDTMHESRDDWALLGDGTWVSVLYLDIHRRWTPPQPPPAPFTVC